MTHQQVLPDPEWRRLLPRTVAGWMVIIFLAILAGVALRAFDAFWAAIQRGLLTIVTLGIEALKDGIYRDVAMSHHEHAATEGYVLLSYIIVISTVAFIQLVWMRLYEMRDASENRRGPHFTSLLGDTRLERIRRIRFGATFGTLLLLLAIPLVVSQAVFARYQNMAISHYLQLVAIVRPYATEHELASYGSRFALIENKHDYVVLTNEISQRIAAQGLRVPEFKPW